MRRFFGSKNTSPASTEPSRSLTDVSGDLEKKIDHYDRQIADCNRKAKEFLQQAHKGTGGAMARQRAKQQLQRAKMLKNQRDRLMQTSVGVDSIAMAQEQMQFTMETATAMREVIDTTKKMDLDSFADQMYDLQDDMAEMQDQMAEVQDVMDMSFDTAIMDVDDGALDAELDALEMDMIGDSMATSIGAGPVAQPTSSGPVAEERTAGSVGLDYYGL